MVKSNEIAFIREYTLLFSLLLVGLAAYSGPATSYFEKSRDPEIYSYPETAYQQNNSQSDFLSCPEDISTYTDINTCTGFIAFNLNPEFEPDSLTHLVWEMTGATSDASVDKGIHLIDAYTFDEGTTNITYTATWIDGSTSTCSFNVIISDNQVPQFESMPPNITVTADENDCGTQVYWLEPAVSDNCTPNTYIQKQATTGPGSFFEVGTTKVFYTATDDMGNESATESFTVTVRDNISPELELPADFTAECGKEIPAAWQTYNQLTAAGGYAIDNCLLNESSFQLIGEQQSAETCPYALTRVYEIADASGNTTTAEYRIVVNGEEAALKSGQGTAATVTYTKTDVTCNGGNDGAIDLLIQDINGPLTITWSASNGGSGFVQNQEDQTTLTAGDYTVVIDDDDPPVTLNIKINEPEELTATALATDVNCFGGSDGSINLTVNGGTPPYSYSWDNGAGSGEDPTNLSANTYSVTVTDANNCTVNANVSVDQPSQLTASTVPTDVSCYGGSDGSIDLTVNGGTPPYSYSWDNGAGSGEDPTNLSANTYSVEVTDANNCTVNANATVNQPTELAVSAAISDPIRCFGETATIQISASGGTSPYTYNFEGESSNSTGVFTGISGSVAGTDYDWSVTDANGCTTPVQAISVSQPPELTASASAPDVTCNGQTTTVTIAATGGTTPLSYTLNGVTKTNGTFTGVTAGTYNWSVTDANNCGPETGNLTIDEPEPVTIVSADVTTPVSCNGGTATVTIVASGGDGNFSYTFNGQTNSTGVFTGVYAGTGLSIQVTDGIGCGPVFDAIDVNEPTAISASAAVTSEINCNGETATVTISASGGTGTLSYTFNGTTYSTGVFNGITPGTNIPWSVTDANNCGPVTGTLNVTQPNALTASVSETASITCFGGTADIRITASGGTGTKTYSFEGQTDNTTGEFTGIAAGTYNWSVEDDNGCTFSGTYEIQEPTAVEITTIGSNSEICEGETLTLNSQSQGGTGNRSYNWTGPNGFTSNSPNPSIANATAAATGTYQLTVTDENGCTDQLTTDVNVHATPTMNLPSNIEDCHGTVISAITLTGAADSYDWEIDDPSIGFATNTGTDVIPEFTMENTGNSPVTATVTITPSIAEGCEGIPQTFTITVNPIPNVIVTNSAPIICNSGSTSILLNSDVEGVIFDWNATTTSGTTTGFSSGTGTNIVQALSGAGIVEYEITPRTTGPISCSGTSVTVVVEVISTTFDWGINTSGPNATEFCNGDSFSLDFSGSPNGSGEGGDEWYSTYNYQMQTRFEWNVSNVNVTSPVSGVMNNPGILSFMVNNSSDSDQDAIVSITSIIYIRSRSRNRWWHDWGDWGSWEQLCAGGSYTTNITVYPFLSNCPTDYNVTTDLGECTSTFTPDPPSFECSPQTLTWTMSDGSSGNGYIGSYAFGEGTTTVTYEAEDDQGNTSTCSFTVTVTDDEAPEIDGCPTDFNVSMDAGECGAIITWSEPTANDNCDGVLALTRTDGTGLNSGDVFPAGTTTISYSTTDAAGNVSTCSFDITVAPDDEPPVWTCIGDQSECAPAGNPYTMIGDAWDPEVTDNCTGSLTKTYSLSGATTGTGTSLNNVEFNVGTTTVTWTATDINGLSSTCEFDVVITQSPAVTTDPASQSVCQNGSVTFTAAASGTPSPTYKWYKDGVEITGETNSTLQIDPVAETDAGSYTVEVSNSCGAAISAPAVLTVSSMPVITKQPASQSDCRGNSVVFSVAASGGNTPYSYSWEMMRPSEAWIPASGEPNISFPAPGEMQVDNSGNPDNPDQTQYRVTVNDACGNSETSAIATLTVNEVEDVDLVLETICQGEGTSFTAITSGSTPVSFEWIKHTGPGSWDPVVNGGVYSGATTATLTINNATPAESGEYSVRATFNITVPNNNGSNTCRETNYTKVGELTVDEGPAIVTTPATQTICPGTPITQIDISNTNDPTNLNTTYTWTRDNTTILTGIPASGTGNTITGTLSSLDPTIMQTTTFTITASNPNGCISTGTVTVTVGDDEYPTAVCQDVTLPLDATGNAMLTAADIDNGSSDNCGIDELTVSQTSFDCTNVGDNTVTLTVTDVNTNVSTCIATVTIEDTEAPVAVCQDITIQLDASGNATITEADIDNGSSDNCGTPILTLDITSFDCTNLGANTVTLTATDAAGNTNSCTALVTVADTDNPVAIAASVAQTTIDCFDGSATVTITATGGVGTLTYTFDGISNANGIFTGVKAGNGYSWNVTSSTGCGNVSGTFDIVQPDELSATIASTDVTCSSGNDGSITISSPVGGSGSYEFTIDGATNWQSNPTFPNLAPGIYNVQIRDANATACVIVLNSALEVYTLTADVVYTDVTCFGNTDGTITISNAHGGSNNFEYSIDGGSTWQSNGNYTGLAPDTYDVQIRDANETSCVLTLDAALIIAEPAVLSATVSSSDITCFGANDGTITVSLPLGGSGNYEYSVDGGSNWQGSGNFSSLSPGSYNIQIRDAVAKSCVITLDANLVLTEPNILEATLASTDVTCFGAADGTITISSTTGGSGSYEYSINGGVSWESAGNYNSLTPATYDVRIRDANVTSCEIVLDGTLLISEPAILSASVNSTDITCFGANDGTITISSSAGGSGSYEYSINGGVNWLSSSAYSSLTPGTYDIRIRDLNEPACEITLDAALLIDEPAVLSATVAKTDITCFGANDGTITISSPAGGYGSYEVSVNGTDWFDVSAATPYSFTNLSPGNYTTQLRDKANPLCRIDFPEQNLTEPDVLSATVASTNVSCNGLVDGTISISDPLGGSGTYNYSVDGGTTWYPTGNFTTLVAGFYNVLIRDAATAGMANECIVTLDAALEITQPDAMIVSTQPLDITDCQGSTVVFNTAVTGSVGTINYVWQRKRPSESVFTDIPVSESDVTYTVSGQMQVDNIGNDGSPSGTIYKVIISDDCTSLTSDEATLSVNEITDVTPSEVTSTICDGDDFIFTVTTSGASPTAYQWQKFDGSNWVDIVGATSSQLTISGATAADAGRYAVEVTSQNSDGNPCVANSTAIERNLEVDPAPTVTDFPNDFEVCQGTSVAAYPLSGTPSGVVFDIEGGANIGLSDRTGVSSIPSFIATTGTETITITPRQANGCEGLPVSFTITVNPVPNVSVSPSMQTICSGGTTNIALGTNVTDALVSWTTTITPDGDVTGASDISDQLVNQIQQTLTNTTDDPVTVVYYVSASKDGCSGAQTPVTITVLPQIVLSITDPETVCSPEVVDLTDPAITTGSSSGLTYTYWLDATATIPFSNPTAAGDGTYYIKASRTTTSPTRTCYETAPVTVTVSPTPTVVITDPAAICAPGTMNLTDPSVTAGSDPGLTYTYWEDAAATIPFADYANAQTGTYYIKGETAGGCFSIEPVTVEIYTTLTTPEFVDGNYSLACKGSSPITYAATANNLVNISYDLDAASKAAGNSINTASGEVTFNPNFTGIIQVIATATGCSETVEAIHSIHISEPPTVNLTALPNSICEGNNITLTATNSGGATFADYSGSQTVNQGIPDNSMVGVSSSITLSGSGATLSANDILIATLNIEHTRTGDIDVFLVAPSGNSAMLLTRDRGGGGDDYRNTIVRTDAVSDIANAIAPFNGTYYPQRGITETSNSANIGGAPDNSGDYSSIIPNSSIEGEAIDGDWTIYVFDDNSGQTGTFIDWSLSIIKETTSDYETVFSGSGATGSSIANTGTAVEVVIPTAGTQTYTATTTDENGCSTTSSSVSATVNVTPDAYIHADYCAIDGKIELTALGGASGATYSWSTGESTQAIVVDEVNIYSVTITNPNGCSATDYLDVSNELVVNGDFEAGNTGFSTGYGFVNPYLNSPPSDAPSSGTPGSSLWPEDLYGIGTNARYYHTNFWGRQDHTNGAGNFMIVNGNRTAGTAIWEQTVNVEPNTNYYFSAWSMSLNSAGNDAVLQFEVNGVLVGSQARLAPGVSDNSNNGWTRFYSNPLWNSGSVSGPITIRIKNVEPAAGGNDFGLDDISFGTLDPLPLEIDVIADDVCEGDDIYLYSNVEHGLEPITYSWTGPDGFTSSEQNPVIENATAANQGIYRLEATDGYGCDITPDEDEVLVYAAPTVDAGEDQDVCTANPVVALTATIDGTAATSVTWSNNGGDGTFSATDIPDPTYTLGPNEVAAGVALLTVTTNDPDGPCDAVFDDIEITIFNSLEIEVASETPLCFGGGDGSATATVTVESTPPYEYLWSDGQTSATAYDLSAGTYSVTVTDANGCTATQDIEVTEPLVFFIDATPVIVAPSCYGANDGEATIIASGGTEPHSFTWDAAAGNQTTATASNLPAGSYNVFVTDANGCSATNIQVTIPQPEPPSLTCPPNVEDIIADNGCSITLGVVTDPVYSGFCTETLNYTLTGATTTASPGEGTVTGQTFNIGITTVTYTVSDIAGNSESCSFTVEVKDLNPPVFDDGCPLDDIQIDADANLCTADVTVPVPNVSDPCGEGFTLVNDFNGTADASGTYPLGSTLVTWTVTDASGNSTTCSQTITVVDVTAPAITCPAIAAETAGLYNCFKILAQLTNPVINDDCTPTEDLILTWTRTGSAPNSGTGTVSGESFDLGTTTVTYTVEDAAGNTATCDFDVTILDITPPEFEVDCPITTLTATANTGECDAFVNVPGPAVTDPCGELVTLTHDSPYSSNTTDADGTYPVGSTPITWTATDASGNVTTCEQTVVVYDVDKPTIDCIDVLFEDFITDGGCTLVPITLPDPVINDCELTGLTYELTGATTFTGNADDFNYAKDATFNIGITTVTYTVEDASGNSATCEFDVWIKNIDNPRFTVTCPSGADQNIIVPAEPALCDAEVTVPAPVIDNFCNEVFSITYNGTAISTTLPIQPVVERFDVGVHTVEWIITDASGNEYTCEQTIEVTDVNSVLACPSDIERPVDPGEVFATLISTQDPTITNNCADPRLIWELVPPAAFVSEYPLPEDLSGTGIYPTNGTFYLGVTTITYSLTDAGGNVLINNNGDPISCSFTVTITDKPIIDCPDDESFSADENCEYPFNPGVPTLTQGSQPLDWTWTMAYPDAGTIIDNGGSSTTDGSPVPDPIVAGAPHEYPFQIGVTTIVWTATDLYGNSTTCTQTVTVTDYEPPTFTTASYEDCVDLLHSVTYDPNNPNPVVNHIDPNLIKNPSPDYATFKAGNTALDLTNLADNCCDISEMTIHWRIDFTDTPDPLNASATLAHASISGTGQPSSHGSDIELPGDGVDFTTVTHTITYWVDDCNGNTSNDQTVDIRVTPRPQIIKTEY